jgi:hypothetical protein
LKKLEVAEDDQEDLEAEAHQETESSEEEEAMCATTATRRDILLETARRSRAEAGEKEEMSLEGLTVDASSAMRRVTRRSIVPIGEEVVVVVEEAIKTGLAQFREVHPEEGQERHDQDPGRTGGKSHIFNC